MTGTLTAAPVIPAYGAGTLSDVVPAVAASLGVPGWSDALGLPEAPRWVVLLVDGLGDLNLAASAEHAPFLTSLRATASSLGSQLSVVQTRQDFTKNIVNALTIGADNLVLADSNEEGAKLLALNTRQQLSQTALSLASQADQGVLRLFG